MDNFRDEKSYGLSLLENVKAEYFKNIRDFGIENQIQTVIGNSEKVIESLKLENGIDMLWVDGGHSYDCVYSDINSYGYYFNENAVICGHDLWSPDVQKACQELLFPNYGVFNHQIFVAKVKEKKEYGLFSTFLGNKINQIRNENTINPEYLIDSIWIKHNDIRKILNR